MFHDFVDLGGPLEQHVDAFYTKTDLLRKMLQCFKLLPLRATQNQKKKRDKLIIILEYESVWRRRPPQKKLLTFK